MITWARRAAVKTTATGQLRRYRAQQVPYAVVQVRSLYGLPTVWLAIKQLDCGTGEYVLGRHRTRHAAEQRCRDDLVAGN